MNKEFQRWSAGYDAKGGIHAPHDAATRLSSGDMVEVDINPKFTLPEGAKYYCIGSCFARHVEDALMKAGQEVLSTQLTLPDFIDSNAIYPPSLLTKFNAFSMNRMLDLAHPESREDIDFLVELSPGQFWNPHLHNLQTYSQDEARAVHERVCDNVSLIKQADCVILTLGLTEYWFDKETGTPLNTTPIDWRHARKTGRFAFRNASFDESLAEMRALIDKIYSLGSADCRVLVTVSPVPLQRTFENRDILISNTYSKAVLRAVCDELNRQDPNVDYFPSFEIVTNSPTELAWHHDRRHVREDFVERVMGVFLSNYVETAA